MHLDKRLSMGGVHMEMSYSYKREPKKNPRRQIVLILDLIILKLNNILLLDFSKIQRIGGKSEGSIKCKNQAWFQIIGW